MIQTVPDVLARIVEQKQIELAACGGITSKLEDRAAESIASRRGFRSSLAAKPPSIIAEIKKASPSKGLLSNNFSPSKIAADYEQGGASALSVLTDVHFFQGGLADLVEARTVTRLPALRKDFTIADFHVVEAAAAGADAILLIAAILTLKELRHFRELAASFKMDALVEVHDAHELQTALDSGAEILGVNNRNLHTFEVRLETSLELADMIPSTLLKVSESGIHSRDDLQRLRAANYQAFLVGEHLMKSGNPEETLRLLLS